MRELAYEIAPGDRALVKCYKCPATETVDLGHPHNPEVVAKRFRRKGWMFNPWVARRCLCPDCNPTTKDKAVEEPPMQIAATVTQLQPVARQLDPAQKAKVRDALDTHYDMANGCYRNGKTDILIGDELNVPFALVEQMRELAYGPLLTDPEVDALVAEHAAIKAKLVQAEKMVTDAMEVFDTASRDARTILDKIEALRNKRKRA